ncbi:54S ribosomal protein img2, mitochondrial [Coniosporium tulheliwenetii]|uniref:54S ribosomal protein img2, mitochondrial n=1 Tax=Coniosporium tulheliwenetii TaxID=3383036 RepID=A0ACC2ZHZ3_9PEZI|nr:54S ribosomal protein img2, mitochondrial [Cladosporium sp. JES 115]
MSSASHTARDQETKVLRTHLNVSINRTDGMLRIYSDPIPPPEHARPTAPSNRLTDPHPDLFSTSPIFPRALHSTAFNTPLQPKLAQSRLAILGIVHTSPSHPLKYHVSRTPSSQLPVYKLAKSGGNLHQTRIKKIAGDVRALRQDVQKLLGLSEKDVMVNSVTQHVVVKGWYKDEIVKFLESKSF